MNGLVFRDIMRGPYVRGSGYIGWTKEHVEPHLETFAAQIPKVVQPHSRRIHVHTR